MGCTGLKCTVQCVWQMYTPGKPHFNQDMEPQEDLTFGCYLSHSAGRLLQVAIVHHTLTGKYQSFIEAPQSWGNQMWQQAQAFNIHHSHHPPKSQSCFFGWVYRWLPGPTVAWWHDSKEMVISGVLWVHPYSPLNYLVGWELECVFWPFAMHFTG